MQFLDLPIGSGKQGELSVSDDIDVTNEQPCISLGDNYRDRSFYVSLLNKDLILHNCILDSKDTNNIMSFGVME
jgi:hypothetical protein